MEKERKFKVSPETMRKLEKFSDSQLKTYYILFYVLSAVILPLSVLIFFFSFIAGLLIFLIGFAFFSFASSCKNTIKQRQEPEWIDFSNSLKRKEVSQKQKLYFPTISDDSYLDFIGKETINLIDGIMHKVLGNEGKPLTFKMSNTDTYNSEIISIYLENLKIGYVNTDSLMNRFVKKSLKNGYEHHAFINKIDVESNSIEYRCVFYEPLENYENKIFSLVRITKKVPEDEIFSRYDNLCRCCVGDDVEIDFNSYTETYLVSNGGDEIGELPSSAVDFMGEHTEAIGIIKEIDTDESAKAKICVYLVG